MGSSTEFEAASTTTCTRVFKHQTTHVSTLAEQHGTNDSAIASAVVDFVKACTSNKIICVVVCCCDLDYNYVKRTALKSKI